MDLFDQLAKAVRDAQAEAHGQYVVLGCMAELVCTLNPDDVRLNSLRESLRKVREAEALVATRNREMIAALPMSTAAVRKSVIEASKGADDVH